LTHRVSHRHQATYRRTRAKQRGLLMLDFIIGAVIGLIVLGAAVSVYIENIKASAETLKSSKLNQEVNAILHLLSTDIQRAGFYAADPASTLPSDNLLSNPFTSGFNDIHVSAKTGELANTCILYSYDLNKNKSIGVSNGSVPNAPLNAPPYDQSNIEQFGFRLNNGVLEMRQGLALGDIDVSCDNGVWTPVHNNLVTITNLTLILNQTCYKIAPYNTSITYCATGDPGQISRDLRINITVALSNDIASTKSGHTFLKIRNDKFVASFP